MEIEPKSNQTNKTKTHFPKNQTRTGMLLV